MQFLVSLAMALATYTTVLGSPLPDTEIHVDITIVGNTANEAAPVPVISSSSGSSYKISGNFEAKVCGRDGAPCDNFNPCCGRWACRANQNENANCKFTG